MKTIAIIGASGFIGSNLVRHMHGLGFDVIPMSSFDGSGLDLHSGLMPANFKFTKKVDAVIYAAQSPHYKDVPKFAWHLMSVNSVAPLQVAVAAEKAGAKYFIYLSTGNVYKHSFCPLKEADEIGGVDWYSFSKIQGERALSLLAGGMQVTSVRIFAVYGPGQKEKLIPNIMRSVEGDKEIMLASARAGIVDGGMRINPCYIDDAVDVLTHLACHGGPEILNLAGPQIVSIEDIANFWSEQCGVKPRFSVSSGVRNFDLVASTELLNLSFGNSFKSFEYGIEQIAINTKN